MTPQVYVSKLSLKWCVCVHCSIIACAGCSIGWNVVRSVSLLLQEDHVCVCLCLKVHTRVCARWAPCCCHAYLASQGLCDVWYAMNEGRRDSSDLCATWGVI
jgi:hypothetical protein